MAVAVGSGIACAERMRDADSIPDLEIKPALERRQGGTAFDNKAIFSRRVIRQTPGICAAQPTPMAQDHVDHGLSYEEPKPAT